MATTGVRGAGKQSKYYRDTGTLYVAYVFVFRGKISCN